MTEETMPRLLSATQAGEYLACSTKMIRKLVAQERIQVIRLPKHPRKAWFDQRDLDQLIEETKRKGKGAPKKKVYEDPEARLGALSDEIVAAVKADDRALVWKLAVEMVEADAQAKKLAALYEKHRKSLSR